MPIHELDVKVWHYFGFVRVNFNMLMEEKEKISKTQEEDDIDKIALFDGGVSVYIYFDKKTVMLPRWIFKQIINDHLLIGSENDIKGHI